MNYQKQYTSNEENTRKTRLNRDIRENDTNVNNNKSVSPGKYVDSGKYKVNYINKKSISPSRMKGNALTLINLNKGPNGKNSSNSNSLEKSKPYEGQSVFSKLGQNIITQNKNFSNKNLNGANLLDKELNKQATLKSKKKDKIELDIKIINKRVSNSIQDIYQENSSHNTGSTNNLQDNIIPMEITNKEIIIKDNIDIWDLILELELVAENKNHVNLNTKKILKTFENIAYFASKEKPTIFEEFTDNKQYHKLIKLQMITCVYLRYVFSDFNYESNMKAHLKRLLNSINESFILLYENVIVKKETVVGIDNNGELVQYNKSFSDKIAKLYKYHKQQKNLKAKDVLSVFIKHNENIINSIKQFSK